MSSAGQQNSSHCRTISHSNHLKLIQLVEDKITGIDVWLYELNDLLRSVDNIPSDALVDVISELDCIGKKVLTVRKSFSGIKSNSL